MTDIASGFNYSILDNKTMQFLKTKENRMRDIVGKAYTDLGMELKEAQEELSKRGYGCFYEWFESIGYKKDQVYRLIGRYELIVANCDKQELIEELPLSLSYEIAKPTVEPELKAKVLDGEIESLRELREIRKALQEAEREKESAKNSAIHFEKLFNSVKNQPPKVETRTVEKVPDDYSLLKEQSTVAQRLNVENVKLQREIMQQREDYEKRLTKEDQRLSVNRDLKKACKELLQNHAMYAESIVYNFSMSAGEREASQILDAFQLQYSSELQSFFTKIKQMTTVKTVS